MKGKGYREKNRDKIKENRNNYYKRRGKELRIYMLERLPDYYIKSCLHAKELPKEIIETQKLIIQLKRELGLVNKKK